MTFQICSKNLFLTYPQCNESKEDLFKHLEQKFSPERLLVAHELHKNGDNHLHAYVSLNEAFRTRDSRFADYAGYHGNYQGCRSAKNVLKYCTKEEDYISNFDITTLLGVSVPEKTILGKRILEGESLMQIVKEHPKYVFGYKKLKEDVTTLFEDINNAGFEPELPCEVPNPWSLRCLVDTDNKKCHFWFYSSKPNQGKTTCVINPLIRDHHACLFTPQATYVNIRETTKVICIDELKKGSIKYEILNSICDGNYNFRVFMKGCIKLKEKPLVVICSNFSIKEVFPYMHEFVYARFNEYLVGSP